ncbi:MAG: DUF2252 domain-containing protein [Actinobacteria bacterium]|nr:DUF2252 domain-containing protein [Actinomycetota bacterium]
MSDYVNLIPGQAAGTPVAERSGHGRDARKRLPRKSIAEWTPPTDRPRSVDLLKAQEETRIPLLVPIRHTRMAQSPFTFYRGAANVMASDLGRSANSGLWVQLCGDAHLSNFGVYGTPERNLVFDLNDFDETNPGPFEWDVMRLTASFVLAARDNDLGDEVGRQCAVTAAAAYHGVMRTAAEAPYLDNWYTMITPEAIRAVVTAQTTSKQTKTFDKSMDKQVAKIRRRNSWSAVKKLTEVGPDGRRRFLNHPPLLVPIAEMLRDTRVTEAGFDETVFPTLIETFLATMEADRAALLSRYTLLDIAHKVVGVGSVGLPALVGLLQGRDSDDLLVLQFKAAEASVLEQWTAASPFEQHGQRVVVGQRVMQAAGDPFLGWLQGPAGTHFYGRQLRDFKYSMDLNGIQPARLLGYARVCGSALAMAHARAGDPIAIAGYLGKSSTFPDALGAFAITYADLMESDYQDFAAAIASGELEAATPEAAGI